MNKGSFHIERLVVGTLATNCYIVTDPKSHKAIIIDPGDDAQYIIDHVTAQAAHPVMILATHGHFDHVLSSGELQVAYGIPFRMHDKDNFLLDSMNASASHFLHRSVIEQKPKVSTSLVDGEHIHVGDNDLTVMHTEGHTPGSICLYHAAGTILFSGDTIFAQGDTGRTDFSYADSGKLAGSVKIILSLPDDTKILSGHGDDTTVLREKCFHSGKGELLWH